MNFNLYQKDDSRATSLSISDASKVNKYTIASSLTGTYPISLEHNRRLINEIVDNTFDEQKGTCELSSSQCSSIKFQASEYSYDKRLQYWKNVLKDRKMLTSKIQSRTEKKPSDILYNRLVTVDERDKFTVQNLMDLAARINPTAVSAKQLSTLKEKCNIERLLVPELQETLPLFERSKTVKIEITGLPKEIQKELLGKSTLQGAKKPSSWLNSMYLEKRIKEKQCDIERVLEFYPDIDNLQILGVGLFGHKQSEHTADMPIKSGHDICNISTDTNLEEEINGEQIIDDKHLKQFHYAVKINHQEFFIDKKRCNISLQTLTNFKCLPFQTEIKKIFTIQNIGKKVLDFQWQQSHFYYKNSALLKCCDNEFIFDNLPFRLCSGEVHKIFVKFQPRRVSILKSKWILKVNPSFFKRKSEGISMRLSGKCTVPLEYSQKLDEIQGEVITKSNRLMLSTLTSNLADLATDLQPDGCYCPYRRSLNEMELFEQLNLGLKCERFYDLELLKDLHKRAKKPRDKIWDLQVNTLKNIILKVPQTETRAFLFNEFCDILKPMRGSGEDLKTKISKNNEIDRNRFLYVRGIISTALDEWFNLATILEETFHQAAIQVSRKERHLSKENKNSSSNLTREKIEIRRSVLENRVYKLQPYRDAFYLQTYTFLCDFAENFVNVIESNV